MKIQPRKIKEAADKLAIPIIFLGISLVQKFQFEPEVIKPTEPLSGFHRYRKRQAEKADAAKAAAEAAEKAHKAALAAARKLAREMTYEQIKEALLDLLIRV